jgi:hypothetical protein
MTMADLGFFLYMFAGSVADLSLARRKMGPLTCHKVQKACRRRFLRKPPRLLLLPEYLGINSIRRLVEQRMENRNNQYTGVIGRSLHPFQADRKSAGGPIKQTS